MRVPILALLLSMTSSLAYPDVCRACRKGKLCSPHATQEEEELARLLPELESEDPDDRLDALYDIAALTDEHANVPSERVAELLIEALKDDQLVVRERAVYLLCDGQHPESTVTAIVAELDWVRQHMWDLVPRMTGFRGEHGNVGDAMNFLETLMSSCAYVRDDRVVKALGRTLLAMPEEMRGQAVAMAATNSLLDLGTREAVELAMDQLSSWKEGDRYRAVHEALCSFADFLEIEEYPEFGRDTDKEWKSWYDKYARRFERKLGKWKGKPVEEDDED